MSLVVLTSICFNRPLSAVEVPERGLFVGQASFPQQVQRGIPLFGSRAQSDCHLDPGAAGPGPASPSNLSELPNSSIIETEIVVPKPFLSSAFRMDMGSGPGRNARNPDGQNRHSTLQPRRRCSGSPAPGLHTGLAGGISACPSDQRQPATRASSI